MGNKKSKKGLVILLIILAVVLMTIGFAYYTQTLTINGTVTAKASSWNVHYNNDSTITPYGITTTTGSETATSAVIGTNDTDFTFTVTLNEPGDFYEATIYPRNFGTIIAYLESVTLSSLTTAQAKYLTYTVSYNGTTYSATTGSSDVTTTVSPKVALAANTQVPVVVRVEYVQPESASDLPSTDQTITVSGSLNYTSQNS